MKLSINGEFREANFATLGEWVSSEFKNSAGGTKGIAVAVNDCVVPKAKWDSLALKDNDKILVVAATQGG